MNSQISGNPAGANYQAGEVENRIVDTLVSMYATTANEERNILYKQLLGLSENKVDFIKSIIAILGSQFTMQEKLSVTLFFKSYLNNLIVKKELDSFERKGLFEELIKLMFSTEFESQILTNLTPTIESLLFFDESDHLNCQQLIELLFTQIKDYLGDNIEHTTLNQFRVYFSLFRVGTNVIQDTEALSSKLKDNNTVLCAAAEKIIGCLKQSFSNADIKEAQMFSDSIKDWSLLSRDAMQK